MSVMDMQDRELLEFAARAAGIAIAGVGACGIATGKNGSVLIGFWNPLEDDGDALRLAVRLGITIGPESPDVIGRSLCRASWNNRNSSIGEYGDGDPAFATRRAITRAAAEIGKQMPC